MKREMEKRARASRCLGVFGQREMKEKYSEVKMDKKLIRRGGVSRQLVASSVRCM